ncbi:unnamed protein product [Linum tenue]|uniref:Uncharacterized protein n=1 Tax=Linum tenue TaxID=586396 RepID=A0AAV0S413_9ROSI|nr:unnamed protein product [Linum tenue]
MSTPPHVKVEGAQGGRHQPQMIQVPRRMLPSTKRENQQPQMLQKVSEIDVLVGGTLLLMDIADFELFHMHFMEMRITTCG